MDAYREPPAPGGAHEVAWSSLGDSARERLAAACRGGGALLADTPPWQLEPGRAAALALGAAALLGAGLAFVERANPYLGSDGGGPLSAGALGGAAGALLALAGWSLWARRGRPFASGSYLFARELVVIEGDRVRVVPTARLAAIEPAAGGAAQVALRFEGGERHVLDGDAAGLGEQLRRLQGALDGAERTGELGVLERLDPLRDERAAWSTRPAAPARPRPARRWRRAPLVAAALAAALAAVGGAAGHAHAARQGHERRADEALRRGDRAALESLARLGPSAPAASRALDQLALRSPDLCELGRRLRESHTEQLDRALFERARDRGDTARLWEYVALGGPRRQEAERCLLELTLRLGTYDAIQDYLRHAPMRPEIEALWWPMVLARAAKHGDLSELLTISESLAPSPFRDEVRGEIHRVVTRRVEEMTREYRGPLGALLRAVLTRQDAENGPLRIVARGDAPAATREAGGRVIPEWGVEVAFHQQVADTLSNDAGTLTLHVERPARQFPPLFLKYPHEWPLATEPPLAEPEPRLPAAPSPSAELHVRYTLRPAGPGLVDARVTLALRTPGGTPLADPVELAFTAPGPAEHGSRPFGSKLGWEMHQVLRRPPP